MSSEMEGWRRKVAVMAAVLQILVFITIVLDEDRSRLESLIALGAIPFAAFLFWIGRRNADSGGGQVGVQAAPPITLESPLIRAIRGKAFVFAAALMTGVEFIERVLPGMLLSSGSMVQGRYVWLILMSGMSTAFIGAGVVMFRMACAKADPGILRALRRERNQIVAGAGTIMAACVVGIAGNPAALVGLADVLRFLVAVTAAILAIRGVRRAVHKWNPTEVESV